MRWVARAELRSLQFPPADDELIARTGTGRAVDRSTLASPVPPTRTCVPAARRSPDARSRARSDAASAGDHAALVTRPIARAVRLDRRAALGDRRRRIQRQPDQAPGHACRARDPGRARSLPGRRSSPCSARSRALRAPLRAEWCRCRCRRRTAAGPLRCAPFRDRSRRRRRRPPPTSARRRPLPHRQRPRECRTRDTEVVASHQTRVHAADPDARAAVQCAPARPLRYPR